MGSKEIKKVYIKKEDVIEKSEKSIGDLVREAYEEALKKGIKANTIVINKNLVEVKPFVINYGNGFAKLPPMICGMQAFFTDKELPDGYAFSILEAKCTEREALIQQTRESSVREFAFMVKGLIRNWEEYGEVFEDKDVDKIVEEILGE